MKTIMKIALILSALAFAVVANAQAPSATTNSGSSTSPIPATSQDAAQIDFVTVGATMPYATSFAATDFDTWRSNAAALGFDIPTTGAGAVTNTKVWSARRLTPPPPATDSTIFGGFTGDSSQIFVTWPETGAFRLSFSNTVNVDGVTPSPDCASAISSRTVYVLPAPNVTGSVTGHAQVLTCDDTEHTVSFNVRGIGLRQASFTVTRQAISGAATPTSVLTSGTAGTAQTSDVFFTGSTA
ncbi:MAG: hypothetical protein FWC98_02480, partial [Bacteroidales bacterium]|nr:hypothetical protein [Bacteroidales bacterium]